MASSSRRKRRREGLEEEEGEEGNWSDGLPWDVTGEITSRLSSSGDHVRLAAVSVSMRANMAMRPSSHPPWLMLPGNIILDDSHRSLYSYSERKLYIVNLPQISRQQCVGSGSGWIISINHLTFDLQLLDLVSGSTTSLPSITTFSNVASPVLDKYSSGLIKGYMFPPEPEDDVLQDPEEGMMDPKFIYRKRRMMTSSSSEFYFICLEDMHFFYKKAIFFPPASVVFVIYGNWPYRLAFAHLGDESWNEFDLKISSSSCTRAFSDVVFHRGNFLASDTCGWMMALDISSTPPSCTPLAAIRPPKPPNYSKSLNTTFLVESPDGSQLMQVWRHVRFIRGSYPLKKNSFTVFKCDDESKWVKVEHLGGQWVLFLGVNQSLAVSTKHYPELTPNSIYFTHGIMERFEKCDLSTNLGVFHLESGIVEPLFPGIETLLRRGEMPSLLPVWIPHNQGLPLVSKFSQGYHGYTPATSLHGDVDDETKQLVGSGWNGDVPKKVKADLDVTKEEKLSDDLRRLRRVELASHERGLVHLRTLVAMDFDNYVIACANLRNKKPEDKKRKKRTSTKSATAPPLTAEEIKAKRIFAKRQ